MEQITKNEVEEYLLGMFDFKPTPYQLSFTYSCMTLKRIISVWCRQTGKSYTTSRVAIMLARANLPGKRVLLFAPTDRQTEVMARYITEAVDKMIPTRDFYCTRKTMSEFKFSNGCTIACMTAAITTKGETIRGETAKAIIIEEAGSVTDYVMNSVILPMGGTTDPVIIKIGTPRKKNHFYESSLSARYKLHRITWEEGVKYGILKQAIVDEARETCTDIEFRTEWCAEFIEDVDAFFGYELIENCKDDTLDFNNVTKKEGVTYYIGADIARLGQDNTCIVILSVKDQNAIVERIIEISKQTLDYAIDKLNDLITYYKPKRVFVDETGLGSGVRDVLAKQHNFKRLHTGTQISGFPRMPEYSDLIVGVRFTLQSKLDMFSNLKVIMQQGRIKYPSHPKLIAQLRDFRYELTESQNVKLHHSEGGHDDFVDALGLAVKEVNIRKVGFAL